VTSTPDVLSEDVADLALGLLLAVSRRICVGDAFVRAGQWPSRDLPLARRVGGKRAGILGLGRIGRAIARRALGFGMSVAYTGRRPQEAPYRFEPDLRRLAQEADVLFIAAAATPETVGRVDAQVLEALGPDGILVNVARGSIVDEAALVAALASGRLGGAGLDVFAREPQVPEALTGLPNVVLQPHQGSATEECRADMGRLVMENLAAHFAGRPLVTPVV
jgi:lactate dehydrogenase-like 2-hydroxyacid dehydrogenase